MRCSPSYNFRLYGTEEPPAEQRTVSAGPLSLLLQSGGVRSISLGGREVIRGIDFVVRDPHWGSYLPRIYDLQIDQSDGGFRIGYHAECGDGNQSLSYHAVVEGASDGSLEFMVTGAARSRFLTCRTGFIILHPIDDIAGKPVTVTHTDGAIEEAVFPTLITPSQPFTDIRALTQRFAGGVSITCTMEGDAFEMEDQRNWTDASYKTYIRPLSKPYPYWLEDGEPFRQRVSLSVEGSLRAARRDGAKRNIAGGSVSVSIGERVAGQLPEFALALHPDYAEAALDLADTLACTGVGYLFCTFDRSLGHGVGAMQLFRSMGDKLGARLILEAVLPLRDGSGRFTDDPDVLTADVAAIKQAAVEAGVNFAAISASPACYHQSYQPDADWPVAPPLGIVYAALRQAFPQARIAGGMHGYFTELNRFPPPVDAIDLITHSTCAIVHAADDDSVMETLESLPWVFASVQQMAQGKPYWIGPSAIAMRFNPYGRTTAPNPDNIRRAMVAVDPRQRGLFNAAWTLGYIARAATAGVSGLCLSAAAGPCGIACHETGRAHVNPVFPVYHVIRGVASRAGATVRAIESSDPSRLAALAIDSVDGREIWLANLTANQCRVALRGVDPGARLETLDSETFASCCSGPEGPAGTAALLDLSGLALDAYAVVRIRTPR